MRHVMRFNAGIRQVLRLDAHSRWEAALRMSMRFELHHAACLDDLDGVGEGEALGGLDILVLGEHLRGHDLPHKRLVPCASRPFHAQYI